MNVLCEGEVGAGVGVGRVQVGGRLSLLWGEPWFPACPPTYMCCSQVSWLHEVITRIMRSTLQEMPGGYLCRGQNSDLKYMLAFDTARGALEWCLVRRGGRASGG